LNNQQLIEPMDKETKLKEMIQAALSKPLSEKKTRPDYPDIDKDGDREESMKKAAQDKKGNADGRHGLRS
jgi:hypothetical protein